MKPKSFALDEDLIGSIDGYARSLEAQHPGVKVTRSDAVRALIRRGLALDVRSSRE